MDFHQPASTNQLLATARRLIVLVTDLDVDDIALGHRIWAMAKPARIDVTYLCVVRHWGDELKATHKLAQLLSITNDPMFRTEILVRAEISWFKAIKEIQRPGDLILCDASQEISKRIFWKYPLNRVLSNKLQIPVLSVPLI